MKDNLVTVSAAPTQSTMVSVPFTGVDGSGVSVYDFTFENRIPGEGERCDWIKIWYTEESGDCGYNEFFYYEDAEMWLTIDEIPFEEVYPDGLPAGTAFWYEAICDDPELGIERPGQLSFKFFNPLTPAAE